MHSAHRFLAAVLPLAAVSLFTALPAAAQAVRAVATDASTGAPLAEVLVRVESADGVVLGAGFTNEAGAVIVRLAEGGSYQVRAERAGYRIATLPGVSVAAGGATAVAVRLEQRPFAVDTITVIARSEDERGRDAFERRRAMGDGVFLDSAYLEPRAGTAPFAGDLLRDVPGITLGRRGINETIPRSTRGWRCMVMLVDGRPVELKFLDGGTRDLHHIIGPRDVKAVEVYRQWSEVPPEFQQYAQPGRYRCGVYLYWTQARW